MPKRRPQSRQARHTALRQSGIDFDIVDASSTTMESTQPNGDAYTTESLNRKQDDRSELSISRNTTTNPLSPSTDEEDLFDVPPDLPEDPAVKEDSLFDRAPVLSPVAPRRKIEKGALNMEKEETKIVEKEDKEKSKDKPLDPLRDDSRDSLGDHSSLFAFVTKTPSPDKGKRIVFRIILLN